MPPAVKSDAETKPTVTETESADNERLHALRKKIRIGLNTEASVDSSEKAPACRACYQRGWMAALRSLRED